jgi:ADP-heptose:LPS heptosyltransferase
LHLDPQNILVIDFGQLGDVVLSLPALRAVREKFPAATLSILVGKTPSELVRLCGVADEIISVDRVALRDGPKLRSIGDILRLARDIRRRRFDLIIDLHSLPETNILGFISGAMHRLYANRESRSLDLLSNVRPRPPKEDKAKHITERYMDVLGPLGIGSQPGKVSLKPDPADVEFISNTFWHGGSTEKLAGLFPGAGDASRCWDLNNFARLAECLIESGYRPAVFLGPEEAAMKPYVLTTFPTGISIMDTLSISQLVAALSKLSVFVSNDTGPLHLASAAGIPVVVLIDKRAPTTYLPLNSNVTAIRSGKIDEIEVDEVFRAAINILDSN